MVRTRLRLGNDFLIFPVFVIIPAELNDLIAASLEFSLSSNFLANANNNDVCVLLIQNALWLTIYDNCAKGGQFFNYN